MVSGSGRSELSIIVNRVGLIPAELNGTFGLNVTPPILGLSGLCRWAICGVRAPRRHLRLRRGKDRHGLGADHVLYAMDCPYQFVPEEVKVTDDLPVSDADRKKLYQTNAANVFSLKS